MVWCYFASNSFLVLSIRATNQVIPCSISYENFISLCLFLFYDQSLWDTRCLGELCFCALLNVTSLYFFKRIGLLLHLGVYFHYNPNWFNSQNTFHKMQVYMLLCIGYNYYPKFEISLVLTNSWLRFFKFEINQRWWLTVHFIHVDFS